MMHDFRLNIIPPLNRMALGFYEQDINGHRVIAHGGDTALFHSDLSLFVDDGVGLFVSVNSSGAAGSPRELREALFDAFGDRFFPAPPVSTRVDAGTARKHAEQMAGSYFNSRGVRTNFLHILDLMGPIKVGVDEKHNLSLPFVTNTAGKPRRWVEIAPYVWKDVDSGERVAAKLENGQVNRWSFDTVSPFMMFDRVPWYKDPAWLTPAGLFALCVLLLSALAWPAGAIARRRFKAAGRYEGKRLRNQRILHGFQWLSLLMVVGWFSWITLAFSNLSLLAGPLDPLLIAVQVLTPIASIGLVVLGGWNLWAAFKEKRGWFSKLWAVLLLVAAVLILWIVFAFHLIGFGTTY